MPDPKTGQEMMDDMAKEPTLDYYFTTNPKNLTREDYLRYVEVNRRDRAIFIAKGEKVREEKDND